MRALVDAWNRCVEERRRRDEVLIGRWEEATGTDLGPYAERARELLLSVGQS